MGLRSAEQKALPVVGRPRGPEGWCKHPVAIIWPCALSPSGYAAAGKHVAVPAQRCPECLVWLMLWGGYWRWLRAPLLVERIWIRRGRCSVCRRSQALLPDLVLARRLDEVAVIGEGLALKVLGGRGLRSIAEHLGVPYTTARTWWRRFRVRSSMIVAGCTALPVSLDGTAVMLNTTDERAAFDALGVAWQRAQVRFGERVGRIWAFCSRISGGQALATNTTSPWAGGSGADWIAPSAFGGPGP
jgi:hypothetical protein